MWTFIMYGKEYLICDFFLLSKSLGNGFRTSGFDTFFLNRFCFNTFCYLFEQFLWFSPIKIWAYWVWNFLGLHKRLNCLHFRCGNLIQIDDTNKPTVRTVLSCLNWNEYCIQSMSILKRLVVKLLILGRYLLISFECMALMT